MHNFIKKMTLLCLRKFNSDATDYVQSTQPTQTTQTNLYTICYRKIRRHISFFITPIILSSLIACGGGGGGNTATEDPTAPASPASIAATPLGFTSLRVTWDSVPQAERYEVYDSNGEKVATIVPPATSYTATNLSPNTEYTYSIKACNSSSCSTSADSSAATSGNKNGGDTIINSAAELNAIRADSSTLAGNYILAADIDLSDIPTWQPIGDSANGFTGSFDGSGYEISGMAISGYEYAGLFGYVKDASISNLGVNINNINSSSTHAYAGGLAAHANSSFISNVYVIVASDITSSAESSSYAGGLFGRVDNSQISNSYVVVRGSVYSSVSEPSASSYAGGLVGYADSSSISNSYYSASRVALQGDFTDTTGTSGVAKTVAQLRALTAESTDWDKDTWYFGTTNDLPKLSSDFVPDVEPPPVNVPASPRGVTVEPLSSTSIRVSWNSVPDVGFYKVYNNRGGSVNATPPATSYTATDLLPNTGYTYRVAACNDSGCSAFTSRSAATPIPIPASPSSISAAGQDFTSVTITWSKVLGTKRYEVYNGAAKVATLDESRTTYIINKDLLPATEYIYSVKACNDVGCSDSTEIDFFTPSIDISSAPQVTVVDSTIGQAAPSLDVSWNDIRGVTSYQIFDAAENKVATVQSPTTSHIITDLSAGILYEYKVRGCYTPSVTAPGAPESTEICGDFSAVGSATTPVAIPATPSNVAAAVQGLTSIRISWDSVDGAATYEVYNGDVQVATIDDPATSYTATALLPNTGYTYSVKACNTSGCSVAASAATTRTPVAIPATPSNVAAAVQGLTSIIISWNSVVGADRYEVNNSDGVVTTIDDPATTSYTVSGLSPNTEYTYSVKACNTSGCSVAASAATTRTPVAIPDSSSSISTGSLNLTARSITWRAVSGATSYEVYKGDEKVDAIDAPTTSYNATALLPNTEYTYSVKACNISGCSVSTEITFTTEPIGVSSTLEVTVVTSTIGQANPSLMVSWDGITGVTSYQIFDAAGNADENKVATVPAPKTSHIIAGLTAGTLYEYRVRGCYTPSAPGSSEVCGDFSAVDSATTPVAIPAVPSNVAAAVQGLTSIRISWDSIDGAEYYEVHNGNVLVANNTHPNTSYTATDLLPATEYTYSVKACNTSGCSDSASAATTPTPVAIPDSPSSISAVAQDFTSISIQWRAVSGATSYEVYKGDVKVATIDAPTTRHTATGLLPSTEYIYSVKACNESGCSNSSELDFFSPPIGISSTPRVTVVDSTIGQANPSLELSWNYIRVVTSYQIFDAAGNADENKVATVPAPKTSHIIAGLTADTLYEYRVRGCYTPSAPGSTEICGDFSAVGSATTPVVIPDSSGGVTIGLLGFTSITITWGEVSGATSYEVYKGDAKVDTIDASTTSYTATDLLPATEYTYSVKACNNSGCSVVGGITATTKAIGASNAPRITAVASTIGQATPSLNVSWDHISGVTSYQIFDAAENKVATVPNSKTSHIIADLSAGTLYTYKVRGCYAPSAESAEVCGDFSEVGSERTPVAIPDSPSSISAGSLSLTARSITWRAVSGATSYEVYKGNEKASTINAPTTSYTATALLPNIGYTYSVKACNTSGCSDPTEVSFTTDPIDVSSAPQVTVVTSTIGQANPSLNVSWDYIRGVTSYQIFDADENADENAAENKVATVPTPNRSHIIANLSAGTLYKYKVRGCYTPSVTAPGAPESIEICGEFSPVGSATTPVAIPVPSGVTATELGITSLIISWNSVEGAVTYQVHNSGGLVATIDAPATSYTATDLLPNTEYTYSVKACNLSGCSDSVSASATTENGITISSSAELAAIRTNRSTLDGDYALTGNIDLSHILNWQPIGDKANRFTGSFDGNGYNISGVSSSDYQHAGLFGYVQNADISNVGVLIGSISSTSPNGFSSSGGLVGRAVSSEIINSYAVVEGSISSYSNSGGLVGYASSSPISNSYAVVGGSISSSDSSSNSRSGGLVGNAEGSPISNSYAVVEGSISSSSTSGFSASGGLIGNADNSPISNSYAVVERSISSSLSGDSNAGGLVGLANNSPISKSYYSASRKSSEGGFSNTLGISQTPAQLRRLTAASTSWNDSIWDFGTNDDLPKLRSLPPSVPASITAAALGLSSIKISWDSVEGAVTYQVHNSEGLVATIETPATSYTATDLLPNTEYTYRVRACNLFGCSDFASASATTMIFRISSATELVAIRTNSTSLARDYALTGNIDLSHIPNWQPIGNLTNKFTGSFNGNGYNISGVSSSGYQFAGLFGFVEDASISNLGVLAGNISSSSEYSYSGGLAGYADDSQISNSYAVVEGSISSSSSSSSSSGGLVGSAENSPIINSYAVIEGDISSTSSSGTTSGGLIGYAGRSPISNSYAVVGGSISSISSSPSSSNSGGLVGVVHSSPIINSYAVIEGDISSSSSLFSRSGGLVGYAHESPISNSYAVVEGGISSSSDAGGLVGDGSGNAISKYYYSASRKSSEGAFTNTHGTSQKLAELRALTASATGWNAGIWDFGTAVNLPTLRSLPSPAPAIPGDVTATALSLSTISISWDSVDRATSYQVLDNSGGLLTTTATSSADLGLLPATQYTYRVRACNLFGCSAFASDVSTTTDATVGKTSAPQVTLVASTIGRIMPSLKVSWDSIAGVTSYQIFDATGNNKVATVPVPLDEYVFPAPSTEYIVAGLAAGTLYEYQVRGCYDSGVSASPPESSEVCGELSPVGSATTSRFIPFAPSRVTATVLGITSLSISWNSVEGATSYQVHNSGGGLVATIEDPATSYTTRDLLPNTRYTYSVKACNGSSCSASVSASATTENGVLINSAAELAAIRSNSNTLARHYALTRNIDLSSMPNWRPIGDETHAFTGNFDGNGYNISGVSSSGYKYAGLFGSVQNANIRNIGVLVGSISSTSPNGFSSSGALVGRAVSSEISNSYAVVAGSITSDSNSGGLVGYAYDSSISNSYAVVAGGISSTSSNSRSGGLVGGASNSSISNSYAVVGGSISSRSSGGLVGNADNSPISNSYAVVGGNILSSSSSSSYGSNSGGLVGRARASGISNSYAVVEGSISSSSSGYSYSGGLVGYASYSPISNSYAVVERGISSSAAFYSYSGGLVGNAVDSPISNSYAVVEGSISSSAASSSSSSSSSSYSGGLFGAADNSPISNSYALVENSISSRINTPYLTTTGSSPSSYSGGLVGYAWRSPISNTYAVVEGSISSSSSSAVFSYASYSYSGGLVGYAQDSPISDSYALVTSSISSYSYSSSFSSSSYSGGLVGLAYTSEGSLISNSYAVVEGSISSYPFTGGVVGGVEDRRTFFSYGIISKSYYSASTSSGEAFSNTLGTSQTVAQLRHLTASATNWNAGIWNFGTDANLPILRSLPSPAVILPLASPEDFTATAWGLTSISISWDRVGRATSYEVHNSEGLITTINSPTTTSYAITGLLPDTEYTYRVRACNLFDCSDFVSASAVTMVVRISSALELAAIRSNRAALAGDYALTGNIDLSHILNWEPIGNSINAFTGSFDGNGYNIGGIRSRGYQYAGLFGYVENANISNVGVLAGSISSSSDLSASGGLVGYASSSQISNSYAVVEGSISSSSSSSDFSASGGLVGYARSSEISKSYAVVEGSISSSYFSGGLVGRVHESPISNSYALVGGSILSSDYSGGLVGHAHASRISNSYALVEDGISSSESDYSGGLVGRAINSQISKSYYSASHKSSEEGFDNTHGTSQTVAQLRALTASATDWDAGIWDFGTDANLPTLRSLPSPAATRSPANLGDVTAAALGLTSISISWDSVDKATSYEVYNSGALVTTIEDPATSHTFTDLLPDTQYTYRVRACNLFSCSAFASASATTMIFRISSAAELAAIHTNSATLAGHYALTGNIDLSRIPNWKPIGDKANRFTGSFDGNGYNISGVSSSGYQHAGLFGWVEDAIISNVGVLVGSISSTSPNGFSSSGALVGRAGSSEISNSYAVVAGSITSDSNSGGLVGNAVYSVISNSYAVVEGNILSSNSASNSRSGGLVGYADNSPISNSYAVVGGRISSSSSSYSYSGGLVGYASISSPISNSYAIVTGDISSSSSSSSSGSYSGGLVGYASSSSSPISDSYAVVEGSISSTSSSSRSYSGGLVGWASSSIPISNSYYRASRKSSEGGFGNTLGTLQTVAELRALTASATGWNAGIWDFGTAANLPTLRSLPSPAPASPGDVTATALGLTSISISWDSVDKATYYQVHNGGALVTTIQPPASSYTATGLLPDTQYTYRVRACNLFGCSAFASASAMTMVFRISSAAELAAIRYNSITLSGDYALTGNIDLSDISNWQPIGNGTNKFTGSFDGNGYNISGVSSTGYRFAGLFGYVEGASISNVGVLVGNISSSGLYSGGLVGYADNSPISNSYAVVEGRISSSSSSDSYSGGLVGYAEDSPISNSYAVVEGRISSSNSGGLVGYASSSQISNSYAVVEGRISSGSYSSGSYSGGLVGRARYSRISNSYAVVEGDISSSSYLSGSYSGGLVGYTNNSPISNSYAVVGGSISSSSSKQVSFSGGLVGWAYDRHVSNSYAVVGGSISSSSSSGFSSYSGGLVGWASSSPISNSYAVVGGSISSSSLSSSASLSGGLVGVAYYSSISNSYAVVEGSISSSSSARSGGLVASAYESPISKSYYSASRKSSEGGFSNTHGTSQTVAELRILTASVTTWDGAVWDFGTDANLPKLRSLSFPVATSSLASPEDVTATALSLSSISMSWSSVVGATSYEVYNSDGLVGSTSHPATNYAATGLLPNTQYTYRVRACNLFGCSAFASASVVTRATSVSSAADLAAIRTNSNTLAGDYALTGNIDLSHIPYWQPIGGGTNKFTGSFNGNGYNISGVSSSGYRYAGLFGYVDGANISNVGVVVGNISSPSYSGGLVGYADNSQISNSYVVVEGRISSSYSSDSYSGGLVGYAEDSPISNSYAFVEGDISSSSPSSNSYSGGLVGAAFNNSPISNSYAFVEGGISSSSSLSSYSGGLVGRAQSSLISNSYAVVGGSISSSLSLSSSLSGGLVGLASNSPISNSYALVEGRISSSSSGSSYSGGLVGTAFSSSISDSYYSASRKSSEGEFSNTLGTSQTVAQLRVLTAEVTTWDAGIWDFGTDANLPKLRFLSFPIATSSLASPGDVTATALSLSSIRMSWSSVVGATSYEVYNSEGLVTSTSHPATNYAATGLLPATQYTYRIRACNLFGCSDFASDVSATTDATVGKTSAPQVTVVASTIGRIMPSLKVSWDSIAGVTSYQIFDAAGNTDENKVATVSTPSTEYVVAGLAAGTLYEYQVRGCYDSGVSASPPESSEVCGELSPVGSATTSRFIPSAPSGVTATALGITSLSISWNSVEGAVTYQVHNSGGLVATIEAPTTSYTTRDLLPNKRYTYSVKACHNSDCSASVSASATTENGITISSATELAAIHTDSTSLAGDYALTGNIDLSHISNWQPIGDFTNRFTGSFDGNGYKISGVSSSGYQFAGLFGYVSSASISNVGVLIRSISATSPSGFSNLGGLVGRADYSVISNSYVVVEGSISSIYISGGLVGRADSSEISNSYAVVEGGISSSSSYYDSYSGGLVGFAVGGGGGTISNSYAVVRGGISSSSSPGRPSYSGGLVGLAGSSIINSYAVVEGGISASTSSSSFTAAGGLVGSGAENLISKSYYSASRKSSEGAFSNTLGASQKLAQLRALTASATGWNAGIWYFGTAANLPTLRSLPSPAPAIPGDFTATALGLTSISISWDSVDKATSYQVYNSGALVSAIHPPASSYTATDLLPDTQYTYWVRACNFFGCSAFASASAMTTRATSISSVAGLAAIRTDSATLSGDYALTGNIDLSDISNWQPIGNGTNKFTGSFNGNGYNISGVSSSGYQHAGLFGYVEDASISNVGVVVGNISSSSSSSSLSSSGGLVGSATRSPISNSYAVVEGSISSSSSSFSYSGGLVGYAWYSPISNSYAVVGGSISSSSSSSSSSSGGLVGSADRGPISNSYAVVEGSISSSSSSSYSNSYSGGLVGIAWISPISNSYAVVGGSISSTSTSTSTSSSSSSGGLVGHAYSSPIINSYAVVGGSISSSSTSRSYSGGLVGYAVNRPISSSYAVVGGSISSTSGSSSSGGLVGYANDNSPISNSYYRASRKSSEGAFTNTLGTSQTLAELRRLTADATDWDEVVWDFGTNNDLPTLRSLPSSDIIATLSPASPEDFTATALGLTSLSMSWGSVVGATSYEVHNGGALVTTIESPATNYAATGLLPEMEYTYRVRACNLFGCSDFASASAMTMVASISSAADLAAIRTNSNTLAGDYALTGNIDLSDISNWQPIGDFTNKFTGSFDGNDYNISGVSSSGYQYAGLFGYVENADISNVGVLVGNISSSSSSDSYSGGLVGYADYSEISNSYAVVEGGISSDYNSGGLVGYASRSPISNSYAVVEGSISSSSSSSGFSASGGLVGWTFISPISNSYVVVAGSISSSSSGSSYSGGLVGLAYNGSPISNSYAVVAGSISSSSSSYSSSTYSYSGGLVGYADYSEISNSYAVVARSISSSSSSSDSYSYSGGLVGFADSNGPISNSYAVVAGSISSSSSSSSSYSYSSSYSGGLVGLASYSPISNSYAVVGGSISSTSGSSSSGGLVGYANDNSPISNSYYRASRKSSEGTFTNTLGTSQTLAELRRLTADATGWDEVVWDFGTNNDLPTLRSLPSPAGIVSPLPLLPDPDTDPAPDPDSNNGVGKETNRDTDGDGTPDHVDTDDDDDNYSDALDVDDDGDGLIEIATAEQLNQVRHNLLGGSLKTSAGDAGADTGCGGLNGITECNGYELVADISLAGYNSNNWLPIGSCPTFTEANVCTDVSALFNTVFDGNGYTISNLTITNSIESYTNATGLFGAISPASQLRNVHIRSANLIGGANNVGMLVGYAARASIIDSSAVGEITAYGANVGGLVGYGWNTTIISSYAAGGNIVGVLGVGGLVGSGERATISSSYAAGGDVGGVVYIGGLVGSGNSVTISLSYAAGGHVSGALGGAGGLVGSGENARVISSYAAGGNVSGFASIGGLIGSGENATIISSYAAGDAVLTGFGVGDGLVGSEGVTATDSYWDSDTTGVAAGIYGLPQTTRELQTPTSATGIYTNWATDECDDGGDAWDFGTASQYPVLTCTPNGVEAQRP